MTRLHYNLVFLPFLTVLPAGNERPTRCPDVNARMKSGRQPGHGHYILNLGKWEPGGQHSLRSEDPLNYLPNFSAEILWLTG